MAETLGSLIDKLTIKDIREFHLRQMLEEKDAKFSSAQINEKLEILDKQKKDLVTEIDDYIDIAIARGKTVRDEKLKIYNDVADMNRISACSGVADAISGLAQKNLELWHLEDEARRKDVTLEYIGGVKKKIDLTNQQRNDYIDKIDELFEIKISKK
jgi:hypothetical protein